MPVDFLDSATTNTGTINIDSNIDFPASTSTCTIMLWANFDAFLGGGDAHDPRLLSKASETSEAEHWWMLGTLESGGSKIRVRLRSTGTTTFVATSGTMVTGVDYHLAFTYSSPAVVLYLNTVNVGGGNMNTPGNIGVNSGVGVAIGNQPAGNRPHNGRLWDVRIYTRVLSSAEFQTIYTAKGTDNIVNGLMARWPLSEGSPGANVTGAGTIKDISGNKYNGTYSGSPASQYAAELVNLGYHKRRF